MTVATVHELPELPPGTPKFVVQQVKDMDRIIGRIEKEDSYEMFRTKRDPIDNLKGTHDGTSGAEGQEEGATGMGRQSGAAAVASATTAAVSTAAASTVAKPAVASSPKPVVAATRGWMALVRTKSPNQKKVTTPTPSSSNTAVSMEKDAALTSAKHDGVGGWEHPSSDRKRSTSLSEASQGCDGTSPAGDSQGLSGNVASRSVCSRKRPRKGTESTLTRRQFADTGTDNPHPPPPPPPPPRPSPSPPPEAATTRPPLVENNREVQEVNGKQQEQQLKEQKEDTPVTATLKDEAVTEAVAVAAAVSPDEEEEKAQEERSSAATAPINLPQIRDRFVSGYYLPTPDSFLVRPEIIPPTMATRVDIGGDQSGKATACATGNHVSNADARPTAGDKRGNSGATKGTPKVEPIAQTSLSSTRSPQGDSPGAAGGPPVTTENAAKTATNAISDTTVCTVSSAISAVSIRLNASAKPSMLHAAGPEDNTRKTVVLTEDAGRLGPKAQLTFEYEPLLHWDALRSDVTSMVGRMERGAAEWRAGKQERGNSIGSSKWVIGAEREEEADGEGEEEEPFDDASVDAYMVKVRRFLSASEELVTRQREKCEKEVTCCATLRKNSPPLPKIVF